MSDEKRSWRDVDRRKDTSQHRREERPGSGGGPKGQRHQQTYRAALDQLFDSGRVASLVKERDKVTGATIDSEQSSEQKSLTARVLAANTSLEVSAAVHAYLAKLPVPEDFDLLEKFLQSRNETFQRDALEKLRGLDAKAMQTKRALIGRLKLIAETSGDPEIADLARGLVEPA